MYGTDRSEALTDEGSRAYSWSTNDSACARRCAAMLEVREELGLASINCCQVATSTTYRELVLA